MGVEIWSWTLVQRDTSTHKTLDLRIVFLKDKYILIERTWK